MNTQNTDLPDLIAGALGVSRGTAYDMMREALAEQPEPDYKALWQQMCERCDELDAKLAQPERKPLTDEEIVQTLGNIRERLDGNVFYAFARAIEAKLREKNNG